MSHMRVTADFDLCQGHAVCMGEAPEVFQVDDQGFLTIVQEMPPESLRTAVEAAVKYCPTQALSVEG